MAVTRLGAGTVQFTFADPGTPEVFSCEVSSMAIGHGYVEQDRTAVLCDETPPPVDRVRDNDSVTLGLINDLTATGLYSRLLAHDLEDAEVTLTPNDLAGASWTGTVIVTLPEEIGAGAWGDEIASEVELTARGQLAHTPAA